MAQLQRLFKLLTNGAFVKPLRDGLKALGWAIGGGALAFAVSRSWLGGLYLPILLPVVAAPLAAHRWHRSARIAWFTAGWAILLLAVLGVFAWWELRQAHFWST